MDEWGPRKWAGGKLSWEGAFERITFENKLYEKVDVIEI